VGSARSKRGEKVVPNKLKDDAIIEAMCQVVFASSEIPEVLVGRLTDVPELGYQTQQLAAANIPPPIRREDAGLRREPLFQLSKDSKMIRVGERVISAHVVGPKAYPGWNIFKTDLKAVIAHLFAKAGKSLVIESVTLRYINALVPSRHQVSGPQDLNMEVKVGDMRLEGKLNLNFLVEPDQYHSVTTRVADMSFVQGTIPPGATLVVDVEVNTTASAKPKTLAEVMDWIETAHTLEKKAFFRLIPSQVIEKLKED
jgi:uncharacterized protein (TIGR04255 family)